MNMMRMSYFNEQGDQKQKDLSVDTLRAYNKEAFESHKEFLAASQDPNADDVIADDTNDVITDDANDEICESKLSASSRQSNRNDGNGKPVNVIIFPPAYEYFKDYMGKRKCFGEYLIVFANEEKTLCYKYTPKPKSYWMCMGCYKLPNEQIKISAKTEMEDGKECIKLLRTCHRCEPVTYESIKEKAGRTLKKPNYELVDDTNAKKYLYVYTNVDVDKCICEGYKFYYCNSDRKYRCCADKCNVRAFEVKNGDEDAVLRLNGKHICQSRQLRDYIVEIPNYVRKEKDHIFIFSDRGTKMGYEYAIARREKLYLCLKCKPLGRNVALKLVEDKNGDYVILSKMKHICTNVQYLPDIDKQVFSALRCPQGDEGIAEFDVFEGYLKIHHEADNLVRATCYVVTVVKNGTIEERYAGVAYIGYSEQKEVRLNRHKDFKKCVVAKLIQKYGDVYLVPIYESICACAYDVEAAGIELRKQGTIDFHFMNEKPGEWKSKELQAVCKDRSHPDHDAVGIAYKRMVLEALNKTENFISLFDSD
uniref:Uncharacterized protein n=1 Tax=Panagrolaimus sp. ES5 TaxID=591445 RepID=A0AC34G636_9BILA